MTDRSAASALDVRYGRTPARKRRNLVLIIAAAIAFVIVFSAWVVWGSGVGGSGNIDTTDLGYHGVTNSQITVLESVTTEGGVAAKCAIEALNSDFTVVGWKIIELAASLNPTRQFSVTLRTTERPSTGLIYRCWLT